MSWDDHEELAVSCCGHLASITSNNEMELILSNYSDLQNEWIGGHQPVSCVEDYPKDCWEYTDGSKWWAKWSTCLENDAEDCWEDTGGNWWDKWRYDQPNNYYGAQDCLNLNGNGKDGFNDEYCETMHRAIYIFEVDKAKPWCGSLCSNGESFLSGQCKSTETIFTSEYIDLSKKDEI